MEINKELGERLNNFTGMLADDDFVDVAVAGNYKSVLDKTRSLQDEWFWFGVKSSVEKGNFDTDSLRILIPKELML